MKISSQRIAVIMARTGINYGVLANRAGVSRQTLSTINTRETCTPETAGKIAKALKCEVTDLIEED